MTAATRRTTAALTTTLVLGTLTVLAQQSPGRWDTEKYAKLPQPAEEYTPVQVNDKLYLIGGNAAVLTPGARATHPARVMAYDLANNTWTEKKNTPFFTDHMSAADRERQDLRLRRLRCDDARGAERDARYRVGIRPGRATAGRRSPSSMRSAQPAQPPNSAGRSISSAARPTRSGLTAARRMAASSSAPTRSYDPATNRWETRKPMPTPRNHPAIGVVERKDLSDWRPHHRQQHRRLRRQQRRRRRRIQPCDRFVARDEPHADGPQRPGVDDIPGQDLRRGRRSTRLPH